MSMYNFSRLIKKYSKLNPVHHKKVIGTKVDMENGGDIIEEIELVLINGAVINSKGTIRYEDGGYGYEYKEFLYCYNKLQDADTIIVNDKEYQVFMALDRSRYDSSSEEGLYIYELRTDEE